MCIRVKGFGAGLLTPFSAKAEANSTVTKLTFGKQIACIGGERLDPNSKAFTAGRVFRGILFCTGIGAFIIWGVTICIARRDPNPTSPTQAFTGLCHFLDKAQNLNDLKEQKEAMGRARAFAAAIGATIGNPPEPTPVVSNKGSPPKPQRGSPDILDEPPAKQPELNLGPDPETETKPKPPPEPSPIVPPISDSEAGQKFAHEFHAKMDKYDAAYLEASSAHRQEEKDIICDEIEALKADSKDILKESSPDFAISFFTTYRLLGDLEDVPWEFLGVIPMEKRYNTIDKFSDEMLSGLMNNGLEVIYDVLNGLPECVSIRCLRCDPSGLYILEICAKLDLRHFLKAIRDENIAKKIDESLNDSPDGCISVFAKILCLHPSDEDDILKALVDFVTQGETAGSRAKKIFLRKYNDGKLNCGILHLIGTLYEKLQWHRPDFAASLVRQEKSLTVENPSERIIINTIADIPTGIYGDLELDKIATFEIADQSLRRQVVELIYQQGQHNAALEKICQTPTACGFEIMSEILQRDMSPDDLERSDILTLIPVPVFICFMEYAVDHNMSELLEFLGKTIRIAYHVDINGSIEMYNWTRNTLKKLLANQKIIEELSTISTWCERETSEMWDFALQFTPQSSILETTLNYARAADFFSAFSASKSQKNMPLFLGLCAAGPEFVARALASKHRMAAIFTMTCACDHRICIDKQPMLSSGIGDVLFRLGREMDRDMICSVLNKEKSKYSVSSNTVRWRELVQSLPEDKYLATEICNVILQGRVYEDVLMEYLREIGLLNMPEYVVRLNLSANWFKEFFLRMPWDQNFLSDLRELKISEKITALFGCLSAEAVADVFVYLTDSVTHRFERLYPGKYSPSKTDAIKQLVGEMAGMIVAISSEKEALEKFATRYKDGMYCEEILAVGKLPHKSGSALASESTPTGS